MLACMKKHTLCEGGSVNPKWLVLLWLTLFTSCRATSSLTKLSAHEEYMLYVGSSLKNVFGVNTNVGVCSRKQALIALTCNTVLVTFT